MGASNVLSRRSDAGPGFVPPLAVASRHGFATFLGFIIAGVVPLVAYCFPVPKDIEFEVAGLLALATLFTVGASRAAFTTALAILGHGDAGAGSFAAAIAYGIGALGAALIINGGLSPPERTSCNAAKASPRFLRTHLL